MTNAQLEEKQVIETEISPMIVRAKSITVKNAEERASAVSLVKTLKDMKTTIEERFHPTANKKKTYEVYEDLLETEHAFYDPIDEAIEFLSSKKGGLITAYDTREAQRARQEAELAEAKRQDDEAKEKAKLEAKAEKEREKGNVAKAEALLVQAENPAPKVSFSPAPGKTKDLVVKAKALNIMKLCQLIVDGEIPFTAVEVKEGELNKWAKDKKITDKFDGIELYEVSAGRI